MSRFFSNHNHTTQDFLQRPTIDRSMYVAPTFWTRLIGLFN